MGKIYFNTLFLFAISLIFHLLTYNFFSFWFSPLLYFSIIFLIFVILPFYKSVKSFNEKNHEIINKTICSTCNFFDKNNVYCLKHDNFIEKNKIPCNGNDYEPFYQTNTLKKVKEYAKR